jgi:hypothetical protein
MSNMPKDTDFDVRIIERNLAAGRLDQAQVDAHLDALDDCSEEAEWTVTEMSMPPQLLDEPSDS